ncbi:hemerythrin HHE cation binding domain protein (plasmid) [Peptoclostridium acidaminophilum DSM 3953]|uniref:Hemerythrin HHE cation binding domain protein n=1 Tax=Peptoclostridium acidaminophilum DSM 3953 TaxID=1286171 RepID=W8U9Q3_PEPAC|nr:hemerythrin domain-containing protein [Peptoclostridium acidaminophilum]AHM57581.1 hemerythrin HHE cation binding domain protein [Peptoclostridium acidaminophilum DSM 3953]
MDGIKLMVDEHVYIKRMLLVLRKASYAVMQGAQIDYDDFGKMIDFVRGYADRHHHGKEEKLLFNRMVDEIGGAAEKLVKSGMLVEHDLGRLHMNELEAALERVKAGDDESKLDVIANAVSYTHLLHRHIDKEDAVVYPFAQRQLSSDTLETINSECESFEKQMESEGVQGRYIALLKEMEGKYL